MASGVSEIDQTAFGEKQNEILFVFAVAVTFLTVLAAALVTRCGGSTAPTQSSENHLSNLTITPGTLSPSFSAAVDQYSATVSNTATSVTLTATTSSSKATIQINGGTQTSATSGVPSQPQALRVGATAILVSVFAEDGSIRIYSVTVVRPQ